MECPSCKVRLPSAFFRPSQWRMWPDEPVTWQFKQCKACDGLMPMEAWSWYAAQPKPAPKPPPNPAWIQLIKEDFAFRELVNWVGKCNSRKMCSLINDWMRMERETRKFLSHFGAVEKTDPKHPCHYHCELSGKEYFDPGNWCYSLVFDIITGQSLNKDINWNQETKGDIIEGLLGYHWFRERIFPEFQWVAKGDVIERHVPRALANFVLSDLLILNRKLCFASLHLLDFLAPWVVSIEAFNPFGPFGPLEPLGSSVL